MRPGAASGTRSLGRRRRAVGSRARVLVAALLACALALVACTTRRAVRHTSPLASRLDAELGQVATSPLPAALDGGVTVSPTGPLVGLHVVFVGGFLNEALPGYFLDNAEECHAEGASTSIVEPSSLDDVGADTEHLVEAVRKAARDSGRRVVLVGHSKGGAAALLTALKHPELMLDGTLERVVVIQGAVGGSPIAEGIVGKLSLRDAPVRVKGLQSLSQRDAKALFREALASLRARHTDAEVERVLRHVFYVRSSTSEVSSILLVTHEFLNRQGSGRNDGLVLIEDQKLDVGVDLGTLDADHAALTVAGPISNRPAEYRKAFTRAMFEECFAATPRDEGHSAATQ